MSCFGAESVDVSVMLALNNTVTSTNVELAGAPQVERTSVALHSL